MGSAITAIGIANPAFKKQQSAAIEIVISSLGLSAAKKRLVKSIYKATGIESRHSVVSDFCKPLGEYEFFPNDSTLPFPGTAARMQMYKNNALNLALAAISNCFAKLKTFNKQKITHLITVSCTGMYAPGIDIELVHALDLNPSIERTAINFMGCYGAFNAIKVADAICRAHPKAKVLIVSVELCTIHFQKNESMDSIISNAIFADGAAATLIENSVGNKKELLLDIFHCDLLPQHRQDMAWHIADSGFDIVLSSYVPQAIQTGIAAFAQRLLDMQELSLADIDFYAIHPGSRKILTACEEALGITAGDNKYSYSILRDYGNMSSATVLFVLKLIWEDIQPEHAGKRIFSCAFGPGLTLESMLLRVSH